MPGPVPKRSAERRRVNKVGDETTVKAVGRVPIPLLPAATHEIARRWYLSLRRSGQSKFYEPSDWAAALLVTAFITRMMAESDLAIQAKDYRHVAIKAAQFGAAWNAMDSLLTTEGARRRVRLEVERSAKAQPEEVPAGVTAIEEFRRRQQA